MAEKWIQKAVDKMKKKGTIGAFGKATPKKIAAGKKAGGLQEKRAVFAQNMSKIARSNVRQHFTQGGVPGGRSDHYQEGNAVDGRMSGMTDGKC